MFNLCDLLKLCKLFILWLFIVNNVGATNPESSVQTINKTTAITSKVNNNATTNLNNIDSNTDDLIKLKRRLELEKAEAELKKLKNSGSSEVIGNQIANAQTVVTGVAINQEGRKIAWLQFADSGALTVNIGSKLGKYIVSDISMNGVTLSYVTGREKLTYNNIFLRRAYYAAEKSNKQLNNNINPFFTPSPIVTGANTEGNTNDMVPPIVPVR